MTDPTDSTGRQTNRTRGPDGRYIRTGEAADQDAEMLKLRTSGWSYRRIAEHFDLSTSGVHEAIQKVLHATVEEPAADVRKLELERLDVAYAAVVKVLEAKHVTVSHGKVIYQGEEPLLDDGPVLAAVDRLLKIQERRARLLGLDAPKAVELGGKLTYDIVGVNLENL